MGENKTPQWLIEVQNKSWEPEIILSGIMLTSLFILSSHVYNFYAMLIQDYGVWNVLADNLYNISIVFLTGLKIILIIHLILRGVWTGFVGLSYVFPNGVNINNLHGSQNAVQFDKPDTIVMKIEKICSLLFSFIFTSITFVIGLVMIFAFVVILFIIGIDMVYIRIISLIFAVSVVVITIVATILLRTRLKDTRLKRSLENFVLNYSLTIYFTNIGKRKTYLMFLCYFAIITLLSSPDIAKFKFVNSGSRDVETGSATVALNKDNYETLRSKNLRVPKATINEFFVSDNTITLFISFYKEDLYTIRALQHDAELHEQFDIDVDSIQIGLPDLYKIMIDDHPVSGLRWYATEKATVHQKGIMTTVPLDTLQSGYHVLELDKIYWNIRTGETKLIKDWEIIPFEIKPPSCTGV